MLAGALTSVGCGPTDQAAELAEEIDTTATSTEALTSLGVRKVIPVRVWHLVPWPAIAPPVPVPAWPNRFQDLAWQMKEANDVWIKAGIQFDFTGVETVGARILNNFSGAVGAQQLAWDVPLAGTNPALWSNDEKLTNDLLTIAPTANGSSVGPMKPEFWLMWLATSVLQHTEMPLFITTGGGNSVPGCRGRLPIPGSGDYGVDGYGHDVICNDGVVRLPASGGTGRGYLWGHEFGHFLGLSHVEHIGIASQNGTTDRTIFYDMVFGKKTNGTVQFFNSQAEAQSFLSANPGSALFNKRRPHKPSGAAPATGPEADCVVGPNCAMENTTFWDNVQSAGDPPCATWADLDTGGLLVPGDVRMKGITDVTWSAQNSINMMQILRGPNGAAPDGPDMAPGENLTNTLERCPYHLSPSQAARAWSFLDGTAADDRRLLGSWDDSNPRSTQFPSNWGFLDFDNDGRRDIVYYRPPPVGTYGVEGAVYVKVAGGTSYSVTLGLPSDVPVPMDMDGDGDTDIAFYRRTDGTGLGAIGHWRWRPLTGGTVQDMAFGNGNHSLPLPNLDMDGVSTTVEVGEWSEDTGQVCWATFVNGSGSSTCKALSLGSNSPPGGAGNELMTGLIDTDAKTDFLLLNRATATFKLLTSTSSWNTAVTVTLPTPCADPQLLRGVDANGDGKMDYAAACRVSGAYVWYTRPYSGSTWAGVSFGLLANHDVLFSGFDFDADGISDPCYYRPAATDGGWGYFWVRKSSTNTTFSKNMGTTGWVPFVSDNRTTATQKPEFGVFELRNFNWVFLKWNGTDWVGEQAEQYGITGDVPW